MSDAKKKAAPAVEAQADPTPVVEETKPMAAQPKSKSSSTAVVYRSPRGRSFVGRYLTLTVLDNLTVTLEENVPSEVDAQVASALLELNSDLYVIQTV